MTKYVVLFENTRTEFQTQIDADAFATANGGTVSEIAEDVYFPVVKIRDITPRQIRTALFITMGLTEANIDDMINTLSEPTKTVGMIEWKQSNMFQRGRPLVAVMGQMLGKTEAEIDALWLYAGTL